MTTESSGRAYRLFLAGLSVWLFVLYLTIVLPIDRVIPALSNWMIASVFAALAFVAAMVIVAKLDRTARKTLGNVTLVAVTSLVGLIGVDVATSAYFNLAPRVQVVDVAATRLTDPQLWDAELMPTAYFPTQSGFQLYKPGERIAGVSHGEHYYPDLMRISAIRDSVLRLVPVDFSIDAYGLRNTTPPEASSIFTLGDSFAFGYHTAGTALFQELLHKRLGQPVYNMGVSGSSPLQELQMLEHFLTRFPDRFKPRHVLWMIFEGNDLEESYESARAQPKQEGGAIGRALAGTIVAGFYEIPAMLRRQSLIRRVTDGRMTLRAPSATAPNPLDVDGVRLAYPVYHSARFGNRLFRATYVERAGKPQSYVLNHPNRPRLDQTFERMRALSRDRGFVVTVVIIPSEVRLYKDAYEDFPPISDKPFFIDYVRELSARVGFPSLDLNTLMAPYAANELLYYRDDTHWNPRGHEVVTELLGRYLTRRAPGTPGVSASAR